VKVGDAVAFRTDAFPGEVFKGRVDQIYPELDPGLRSRDVRVVISNEDGRLAPGMYGTASIDVEAFEGIALPEDAVIFGGVTNYVFIAKGGGHFEPRIVETGLQTGGRVQILSGVEEGDEVVSSASFLLDSESKLKAAAGGFGESGGETAADMGHTH
jgi:Cu(I)/Ag(I) efflux system membrane fusion protein